MNRQIMTQLITMIRLISIVLDEDNLEPENLNEIFNKFVIDRIIDHSSSLTNYDKFILKKLTDSFFRPKIQHIYCRLFDSC